MRLRRIYPIVKHHHQEHTVGNCKLIVDGKSFFKNAYQNSGCSYIFGGEYDRYADYLKRLLQNFKKANVEWFVVFNGGMSADIERRLELHQDLINKTYSITYHNRDLNFCEPAFVKDVNKQVLEELGIKYTVCNGENLSEMVNLAKKFACAILTDNVECCLFNVETILTSSLKFNEEFGNFDAKLYEPQFVKSRAGTPYPYDKMAAFLVLMDQNNEYLDALRDLLNVKPNIVGVTFRNWIFRQSKDQVFYHLSRRLKSDVYKQFEDDYQIMLQKLKSTKETLAAKHFRSNLRKRAITDEGFFDVALASGQLTTAYINLRNLSLFSGSWLILDKNRPDAMLAAMEIVRFVHGVLTGFKDLDITFVGSEGVLSRSWAIKSTDEFIKPASGRSYFDYFLKTVLPNISFDRLKSLEKDCKMLIVSLVYYHVKVNKDFACGAYSILFSYVILSQVTKQTGILKKSNYSMDVKETAGKLPAKECLAAADGLVKYFYITEGAAKFDRSVLHEFAQFEHVLTQINYLNEMCGERACCTCYHLTYNGTFIHNIYHLLVKEEEPIGVVEKLLPASPQVLAYFKNVVQVYNDIIDAI